MNDSVRHRSSIDTVFAMVVIAIALAGASFCVQPELLPTRDQRDVKAILHGLELRRSDVFQIASKYLNHHPDQPFAIALAADAASINFEQDEAIRLYRQLPADGRQWEFIANLGLARRCEVKGLLTDEEQHLRRALELNPYNVEANVRLGHLLQIAGRTWEAIAPFSTLVRIGRCRGDELMGVAAPERFFRSDEHLERLGLAAEPPDLMIHLAIARRALYENRVVESETLLRGILNVKPELGEAQGRLGRIIYDRGDPDEFLRWRAQLPNNAANHPEVWFVQGLQARRLGQAEGAVRCFLETLIRSPNHLAATVQIAGCLDQGKYASLAAEFVKRADGLANLESLLNTLRGEVDVDTMKRVVADCADLGRLWEAAGWSYVITHLPDGYKYRNQVGHWINQASLKNEDALVRLSPIGKLRPADFAEPRWGSGHQWSTSPPERSTDENLENVPRTDWRLRDEAIAAGIEFEYYEGTTEETRLQHIFNVVGGGIGATDYDLDGWCDIYLAQANNWRDPSTQPAHSDRLFRNLEGHFIEVTRQAGLGDLSFTHGVTAGDYDQDGFPDLYLGNLGPNRLYRNNGDGTFEDVTIFAGVAGNEWTTSSVFADFNGDSLPDLYVANYSLLEETAKKECKRKSGEPMACSPGMLTAEFHRFYLNLGDGTFRDVTENSGMHLANGRGLGLIAWDFGGEGRMGLFVANDTSANFLFINDGNNPQGIPVFREEATIRGVAVDADGRAQASMGIAAGDADGDGRIDLYITNFFAESDTLYAQRENGFFDDATRQFNLRDAGFWTLGFGCQFLDLDGDGWEDLIATNGHVDQQSSRGDADRMPPQAFRNLRGRKFAEIPPTDLGPFFQKGYLGRGLATVDWNRDGMTDVAISHLHSPFALLTNRTKPIGRPLVIQLIGTTGTLEPTGAVVHVSTQKGNMFRFVTGGDGYLCTNQRRCTFFIPEGQNADEVEVRWPNGRIQRWRHISGGQEVLLIEGRSSPLLLRNF